MQEGPDGYCQAEREVSDGSPAAATPPKPRAGPAADNWEEVHAKTSPACGEEPGHSGG